MTDWSQIAVLLIVTGISFGAGCKYGWASARAEEVIRLKGAIEQHMARSSVNALDAARRLGRLECRDEPHDGPSIPGVSDHG